MRLFDDVASQVDDPYLRHALSLAELGRGSTAPNPLVGCVIESDGVIVGEGYHARAGEPHAEVAALRDAGESARGATAYVTLEPCAHHGKTPPCTEALVAAGVRRVVVGMADPNPLAAGGATVLRDGGVTVDFAADPRPFQLLNEGWLKRLATGMPLTVVKVALTLDGHGALHEGVRAAITGDSGARVTRMLRQRADAVVVGGATVQIDDPALTVRRADGSADEHQPVRVVLVRSTMPAAQSRVFCDGAADTLIVVADGPGEGVPAAPDGVEVVRLPEDGGLASVTSMLGGRGYGEVLFEPGPRLLSSLWAERLIDRLVVVTAGGMAGSAAPPVYLGTADADGEALDHAMEPLEAGIVGDVSVTVWQPADSARAVWT